MVLMACINIYLYIYIYKPDYFLGTGQESMEIPYTCSRFSLYSYCIPLNRPSQRHLRFFLAFSPSAPTIQPFGHH